MKRRTYLIRLVVIVIMILMLPVFFLFGLLGKEAFDEVEKGQNLYYSKVLQTMSNEFEQTLTGLKEHVASICASSKDAKSVFYNGVESFCENEYWYYEAVNEMAEMIPYDASNCYIYYYDLNSIITHSSKVSGEDFARRYSGREDYENWEFLAKENFLMNKVSFATAKSMHSGEKYMLVGYCTVLGMNRDPVLVIYEIRSDEYENTFSMIYGDSEVGFYIYDKETQKIYLEMGAAFQNDVEEMRRSEQTSFYQKEGEDYPFSFVLNVVGDGYQANILEFYHNTRILMVSTVCVWLLLCGCVIYIVYKPIYELTEELDECVEGEFAAIRKSLNMRSARIQEQEMLILDLLINHLVYGLPISQKKISKLGIVNSMCCYLVFVLEGYVLLNSEAEQITKTLEEKFGVKLFVTDWQREKGNVMIAFLKKEEDTTSVEMWLQTWFCEHLTAGYNLLVGKVVDNLNDIRSSLLWCLKEKEKQEKESLGDKMSVKEDIGALELKKEQLRKLEEDILNYLDNHYRDDDLSQTAVADCFQISNYTLSRMFKKQLGVGFTEYVNAKRIEYAKELLLTTSYSVRDISMKAGFTNDNYFSRIFKAMVGVSPTVFRG